MLEQTIASRQFLRESRDDQRSLGVSFSSGCGYGSIILKGREAVKNKQRHEMSNARVLDGKTRSRCMDAQILDYQPLARTSLGSEAGDLGVASSFSRGPCPRK